MSELPYQAEYAKSGRASCKGCKNKIDQGTLRIAVMVQSAFHDGKQPNWHHDDCFFKKQRPKTLSDIGNYNKLKTADQKKIKEQIETYMDVVMPIEKKGKGKGAKRAATTNTNIQAVKDFNIEYAKSSRATCRHCEIKICKDEVRIAKIMYDTEVGKKYGGEPHWYHVKCFADNRSNLMYFAAGENLPGFKTLSKEDQDIVKNEIKSLTSDEVPIKKLKSEPKDEQDLKLEKQKEKDLEKQNKLYHKYRNALSEYPKQDLHELLEANNQNLPPGKDECADRLADIMAFGSLEPCPECKQGQLVLDTFGYKCTEAEPTLDLGNGIIYKRPQLGTYRNPPEPELPEEDDDCVEGSISEWTKCQYITQQPKRVPMKVPSGFKDSSAFRKFKPKTAVRLFMMAPPPPVTFIKKDEPVVKKELKAPPLKNLQFFLYGKFSKPKEEIKHKILKLGGLVVSKLTETTAAVVSTQKDLEKMYSKMAQIQEKDIEVVEESFIDLINAETGTIAEALELIKEKNIADWGSDPAKRVPQDVIDGKSILKSGSMYVKSSKSGKTKLKIKGGTAVDPDSGLEDVAHVYTDYDKTKYTVVLCKTDIVAQKNSYYKLQVLEADNKKKYWLFRSWGRIGTTIGSTKLEDCKSLEDAVQKFEDLYMEKTDNPWECRDMFMKMPDCYYPLDVNYGESDTTNAVMKVDENSKLPVPVQKLIMKIFDINDMKQTLLEFELDTEKMPLGKLSKKQLKQGYKTLSDLLTLIEKGTANQNKIIDSTNKFYTLVPHDFGINNPPPLNSVDLIKNRIEMLDNLLEIEIAYSLLKTESDDETSPIEAHYIKLKASIAPLDRTSVEFEMIQMYVQNTHAATHSNYTLKIEEVFKVVRDGEDKRFKPFRKLHNRRLLWHGSRVTNFVGILSQGLRIAPPEAPVTGYMFGKGVYFADMVSKSANYCCTSNMNPTGLLLLCEVALGDMKECTRDEMITKLPPGKHSTWGIGRTQPDPTQHKVLECGTIVPLGKGVPNKVDTSLLYNEFIVYDVAQVNVKYLLQMKFHHK